MKHKFQLNLLSLMALLAVGLNGCHTPLIHKPNLITDKEAVMMKQQAVIETYRFYEDDNNNLILEMEWLNHRDEAIEGTLGMHPYSVHHDGDQLNDIEIAPYAGTNYKAVVITIPPGEKHTFTYIVNTSNQFLDGTHNYDLLYTANIYESNIVGETKPVGKKINFTWQKFEDSNKGHLISQKLIAY